MKSDDAGNARLDGNRTQRKVLMIRWIYCQMGFEVNVGASSLNNRDIPAHGDCVRLVLGINGKTKHGEDEHFAARLRNPGCSQDARTSMAHTRAYGPRQNVF